MNDVNRLLEEAERQLASGIKDWIEWIDQATGNAQALVPPQEKGATTAGNVLFWLQKIRRSMDSAKTSIERVTDILNTRKVSLELKRIVVESWPRKAWVDRLTYISTALFGIGGVPFAFTAGRITDASLLLAAVTWVSALVLMVWSLHALWKEDNAKRAYFEREFGLAPD